MNIITAIMEYIDYTLWGPVWYFGELLPEITMSLILVFVLGYGIGRDAGRRKAENRFLKKLTDLMYGPAAENDIIVIKKQDNAA